MSYRGSRSCNLKVFPFFKPRVGKKHIALIQDKWHAEKKTPKEIETIEAFRKRMTVILHPNSSKWSFPEMYLISTPKVIHWIFGLSISFHSLSINHWDNPQLKPIQVTRSPSCSPARPGVASPPQAAQASLGASPETRAAAPGSPGRHPRSRMGPSPEECLSRGKLRKNRNILGTK